MSAASSSIEVLSIAISSYRSPVLEFRAWPIALSIYILGIVLMDVILNTFHEDVPKLGTQFALVAIEFSLDSVARKKL